MWYVQYYMVTRMCTRVVKATALLDKTEGRRNVYDDYR